MEVELENGFVSLGLATERLKSGCSPKYHQMSICLGLATERLKYIKSDKEELEDMSRSCDRVD